MHAHYVISFPFFFLLNLIDSEEHNSGFGACLMGFAFDDEILLFSEYINFNFGVVTFLVYKYCNDQVIKIPFFGGWGGGLRVNQNVLACCLASNLGHFGGKYTAKTI